MAVNCVENKSSQNNQRIWQLLLNCFQTKYPMDMEVIELSQKHDSTKKQRDMAMV